MVNRRSLLLGTAALAGLSCFERHALFAGVPGESAWKPYAGNPVLGGEYGTCFDVCVLRERGRFRMWLSWRPKKSIAISESADGIHWSAPEIVLGPLLTTGWEDDINRPVVVLREGRYHMWYTGQNWLPGQTVGGHTAGHSAIGYATSADGRVWTRASEKPVLKPETEWEGAALMSPDVIWDDDMHLWRMWYSGGEQYEPNAIGYATSSDGLAWKKYGSNPAFRPDPAAAWEHARVAGIQVIKVDGWHYAFYIGYRDIDHAQIGLARSKDGITDWQRYRGNPIVRSGGTGFNADASYKPYAVFFKGQWMLWFNGRRANLEQIGLVLHKGYDLWS